MASVIDPIDDGNAERGSFSRARLGLSDDVSALEQQWDRELLNRRRRLELHLVKRVENVIRDIKIFEVDRFWFIGCRYELLLSVTWNYLAAAAWCVARSCAYSAATSIDASMAV